MQLVKINCAALCALFLFAFTQLNAQMYTKGQQDLHFGVGLGSTFYGSGYKSVLPPINVSYEKGITENIGVGGYLGYASSRYNYNGFGDYNYHWTYNYIILGVRGAYHYDLFKNPKLDTYGGIMLGYNIARAKFHSNDPYVNESNYTASSGGGITYSGFLGARYQFKPKLGAYAELGYGVAILNLGLRLKL
jgi:hypothetical protein